MTYGNSARLFKPLGNLRCLLSLSLCLTLVMSRKFMLRAIEGMFVVSLSGVIVNRGNLISVLIMLEVMFLAVNMYSLMASHMIDDIGGQVIVLVSLTLLSCEAAVGLAILVIFFRARGTVLINYTNLLKG